MTSQEEQAYLEEIERVIKAGPYHADWNSLTDWSAPDWFLQKRFGIFIHWGLYSIAAHANEWYSRNMYIKEKEEWEYHRLSVIGGETKITVITFDEGRVSGMNTFVREVYTHPAPVPHIH